MRSVSNILQLDLLARIYFPNRLVEPLFDLRANLMRLCGRVNAGHELKMVLSSGCHRLRNRKVTNASGSQDLKSVKFGFELALFCKLWISLVKRGRNS